MCMEQQGEMRDGKEREGKGALGDDNDHAQRQVECRQIGTSVLLT